MPQLSFKARYVPLVESGQKTHTIRRRRKDRRDPERGDKLYLVAGPRNKKRKRLLGDFVVCTYAVPIRITASTLRVDGRYQQPEKRDKIARSDGFADFSEMAQVFADQYGLPFKGLLVGWGPVIRKRAGRK